MDTKIGRVDDFIAAIHDRTPNGEWIEVQHHPDGDWSIRAAPRAVVANDATGVVFSQEAARKLTDAQWEKFWDFAEEVAVPGEIVETGTDGKARFIYSHRDGIEYRITIEPHFDRFADRPLEGEPF